MAVLIFSTNAPIDRMIPKGVTFAAAVEGAGGGLDTTA